MLTELDIIWKTSPDLPKPPIDKWKVGAFVIDEIVVEIDIYTNEFCDIISSSIASENLEYEDGSILIDFTNKETSEIIQVKLNNKLASIILSDPIFVVVTQETPWVVAGTTYIDGKFGPQNG